MRTSPGHRRRAKLVKQQNGAHIASADLECQHKHELKSRNEGFREFGLKDKSQGMVFQVVKLILFLTR